MLSFVYVTLEVSFSPPSKDVVYTSLDIRVWNSGELSGLKINIWGSLAFTWCSKP